MDTLVEIAGWKKEQQQQQQSNGKDETSTFSDLRKRFGQHRKSIKNRVKKLYNRTNSCDEHHVHTNSNGNGVDINNLNEQNASGSSSCDSATRIGPKNDSFSGYFNKRDRHLFSSMLKKSRTSLTFDELSRKKIINLAAIRSGAKHKPAHNLEVDSFF